MKIGIHSFGNLTVRKNDIFELANERFADTEGRGQFFEKVLEEKPKTIAQIAEDAKKSSPTQVAEITKATVLSMKELGASGVDGIAADPGAVGPDGVQGETGVATSAEVFAGHDKTIPIVNVVAPKKNKAGRPKKNVVSK